uniref:Uncharacterized protein n=1 Tax=Candidatus Kentrum sp. TC TaxID=2126339 RepID=A0A450ZZS6_9GAMM|nr:MAG: hypothetical protein BECKTC1821F_GA0114240_103122 [Candidatus Kentron sp. TC]
MEPIKQQHRKHVELTGKTRRQSGFASSTHWPMIRQFSLKTSLKDIFMGKNEIPSYRLREKTTTMAAGPYMKKAAFPRIRRPRPRKR